MDFLRISIKSAVKKASPQSTQRFRGEVINHNWDRELHLQLQSFLSEVHNKDFTEYQ